MKKIFLFLLTVLFLSVSASVSSAQPAGESVDPKAAEKKAAAAAAAAKPPKPLAFWAATPPEVTGKLEAKYDINGDGLLQTSEVKILLRRISAQIQKDNINFNVEDSKFLKAYDKNKDGIISKLELTDIKKDLSY